MCYYVNIRESTIKSILNRKAFVYVVHIQRLFCCVMDYLTITSLPVNDFPPELIMK